MRTAKTIAAASFVLLFVAACGSSGIGDILGTGTNQQSYSIRGTVDSVDLNSRSIYLTNVSGNTRNLNSGGNYNNVRVYFDDRTTVSFNGQNYRPQDLERGDQVDIRADNSNGSILAESMNVTYNAHGAMTSSSNYPYPSSSSPYPSSSSNYGTIRGTVRSVDTYNHTITLDSANWMSGFRGTTSSNTFTVQYDTNVSVDVNGQFQPVTGLERGDIVDVQVSNVGGSSGYAQSIRLVRDVNQR